LAAANKAVLSRDADRSVFFIALVVVYVLVGLADAISGPYTVLFLVDQAALGPLSLSAILTMRALGGIAFATAFGTWVDRRTSVRPLLLALAGTCAGYTLLPFTMKFAGLHFIAAGPIALGAAAFSQSIALAKRHFEHESLHTTNRAIGVLRASRSLAWAIGPAIGALVVGPFGFRGVFRTGAASGAIALLTLTLVRARPTSRAAGHLHPAKTANEGSAIALAFAALALFHTPMFVGLALSLCAALEIVVTGALIWRPVKRGERPAIVVGFAAFAAYFRHADAGTISQRGPVGPDPPGVRHRARFLSRTSFLQSLLPHRAGAAAALFSNARQVASVAAALGAGARAGVRLDNGLRRPCCSQRRGVVLVRLAEAEANWRGRICRKG
jgi:MFS transporter, SET family, sugar efflux transporter